jgi:sirohydrochlorin ferrochelatase
VARSAQLLSLNIIGQAQALEMHEALLELSQQRIQHAVVNDSQPSALLLVGRGSSDVAAIHHVQNYTQAIAARLQIESHTAFVAAAEPKLRDKLIELAQRQLASVVVLPHLLFAGEVLETIEQAVQQMRMSHPQTQWHLAQHLGAHANVAVALLERVHEVVPYYFKSLM